LKIRTENLNGKFVRKICTKILYGKFVWKIRTENLNGKLELKIWTENLNWNFERKIWTENLNGKFELKICTENLYLFYLLNVNLKFQKSIKKIKNSKVGKPVSVLGIPPWVLTFLRVSLRISCNNIWVLLVSLNWE
jgi:hypothetical protein